MNYNNGNNGMHQKYREQIEEYNRTHPRTSLNETEIPKEKSFSYTEQDSAFFLNRESFLAPVLKPIIIVTIAIISLFFLVFLISNKLIQLVEYSMPFLLLIVFFDAGLGIFLSTLYKDKTLKERCTVPVNAIVIKLEKHAFDYEHRKSASPVYEYSYNGHIYTAQEAGYRIFDIPLLGQEEPIYINPSKPTDFRTKRNGGSLFMKIMGVLFMTSVTLPLVCILSSVFDFYIINDLINSYAIPVFLSIPFIIGIILLVLPPYINKLKRNGCNTKVEAVVSNIAQEKRGSIGIDVFAPVYEYLYDGTMFRANSRTFAVEPIYNIGDTVTIYINNDNPTEIYDNQVQLTSIAKFAGVMFILMSVLLYFPHIIDIIFN